MAGSVNKVILIGNVGRDPEIRTAQNGARFASFSLATGQAWKDKQTGERKERTDWHNISVTNDKLVDIVERFVKKGSKVFIEGQLETRKWQDREGNDNYSTEVVLRPFRGELTLLDTRREDGNQHGTTTPPAGQRKSMSEMPAASETRAFDEDLDDEIPF